ncbi:hypothetical protein HNO86_08335 [Pseudomonas sp. C1C7]|uniref:hypothetical protein n=1 Tax=Pseudomonas sp. C1C7 TaxID=2735272 RepID=UPI0015867B2A|nr:hypothetical protein [Pseudomonas sp. C1C7]NUT75046.1 hypothetical protein [Pseudomonas sp. C1C7]
MNRAFEQTLQALQRLQSEHDNIAHKDILSFDLYKRLKHMVLHFYKYAGKIQEASDANDKAALRKILIDALIICFASANALKLSLSSVISTDENATNLDELCRVLARDNLNQDIFMSSIRDFLLIGGRMAKVMESSDHMEDGNPRSEMRMLVPKLTVSVMSNLGRLDGGLEAYIKSRFSEIEEQWTI